MVEEEAPRLGLRVKVVEEGGRVQLIHNELLDVHQHFVKSVELEAVLLNDLKDGEGDTEQNSDTLEEEQVPDHEHSFKWYLVYEDLHEPGESQQVCIETDVIKVHG